MPDRGETELRFHGPRLVVLGNRQERCKMRRSGLRALMVVQGIHGLYRCRLEHTVLHRRRKIHAPGVDGGKIGGGLHGHGGTGGRYQHTVGHAPDKPAFGVHADKGRQRDDQNGNDDFEHLLSPLRNAETDHAASPSGKPPVSKRRRGPRRCGIATHAPKASGEGVAGHTGASLSAVRKGSSLCCLTTSRPVPRGTRRDGGRRNPHR